MEVFHKPTPDAYRDIIEHLSGLEPSGSRAGETREELGVVIRSDNPRRRWMDRKSMNIAFALQESFAYWRGLNTGHVERYNSNMETWTDDEGELPGSAYGDRMRNTAGHDQLARAEAQLRENPDTRRAVIQVHQTSVEDYDSADVACTNHLHPFVRDSKLHMHANLRSQDMYWGFPYDAQNNQYIQEALAGRLGLGLGEYVHTMESCHYYTDYEDKVEASLDEHSAWETPDARIPNDAHDTAMSLLGEGLARTRNGGRPYEVLDSLNAMVCPYYSDWLCLMVAYELHRFHDDPNEARRWAGKVGDDGWGGWLDRVFDGEQF